MLCCAIEEHIGSHYDTASESVRQHSGLVLHLVSYCTIKSRARLCGACCPIASHSPLFCFVSPDLERVRVGRHRIVGWLTAAGARHWCTLECMASTKQSRSKRQTRKSCRLRLAVLFGTVIFSHNTAHTTQCPFARSFILVPGVSCTTRLHICTYRSRRACTLARSPHSDRPNTTALGVILTPSHYYPLCTHTHTLRVL